MMVVEEEVHNNNRSTEEESDVFVFSSWRTSLESVTYNGRNFLGIAFTIHEREQHEKYLRIIKRILKRVLLGDIYYMVFLLGKQCLTGKLKRGSVNSVFGSIIIVDFMLEISNSEHDNLIRAILSEHLSIPSERTERVNLKRNWKVKIGSMNGILLKAVNQNPEDIKNLACAFLLFTGKNS